MTNYDIVLKWGESTKKGDWDIFHSLTSDDFELIGPAPEPLDKGAYQAWITSLLDANDDHTNNMSMEAVSETVFSGTVQMEGRHTRDWDLSFMGMGVVPATNRHWVNPKENLRVHVLNGKVVRCEVEVPEDGGIKGIMTQLGVPMP